MEVPGLSYQVEVPTIQGTTLSKLAQDGRTVHFALDPKEGIIGLGAVPLDPSIGKYFRAGPAVTHGWITNDNGVFTLHYYAAPREMGTESAALRAKVDWIGVQDSIEKALGVTIARLEEMKL